MTCPCPDKCPVILAQETKIERLNAVIEQYRAYHFKAKALLGMSTADLDMRDRLGRS